MIEDKYNINVRQCAIHLTCRRAKIAGNVTMYKDKNTLPMQ